MCQGSLCFILTVDPQFPLQNPFCLGNADILHQLDLLFKVIDGWWVGGQEYCDNRGIDSFFSEAKLGFGGVCKVRPCPRQVIEPGAKSCCQM